MFNNTFDIKKINLLYIMSHCYMQINKNKEAINIIKELYKEVRKECEKTHI